jgi:hypothetical protein
MLRSKFWVRRVACLLTAGVYRAQQSRRPAWSHRNWALNINGTDTLYLVQETSYWHKNIRVLLARNEHCTAKWLPETATKISKRTGWQVPYPATACLSEPPVTQLLIKPPCPLPQFYANQGPITVLTQPPPSPPHQRTLSHPISLNPTPIFSHMGPGLPSELLPLASKTKIL